jgi:hypothetical protein
VVFRGFHSVRLGIQKGKHFSPLALLRQPLTHLTQTRKFGSPKASAAIAEQLGCARFFACRHCD